MREYGWLAARAKARDTAAFGELYALVYEDLYRMAFYMLGDAEDAKDAVSDAVLDAFAHIQKLRDPAAFRSWIFKILVNRCKGKLRLYQNQPFSIEAAREAADEQGASADGAYLDKLSLFREAQTLSAEEAFDVRQAFLALPDLERTILSMAIFGGYKSAEIADAIGMNANTVRTRQRRALQDLARRLQENERA